MFRSAAALMSAALLMSACASGPPPSQGDGAPPWESLTSPTAALTVILSGQNWPLSVVDPLAPPSAVDEGGGKIVAPMPGRVVSVAVAAGQQVARGEVLLVLEAMKVQMRLAAPRDGVVAAVNAVAGDLVDDGAELVVFEA